MKAELIEEWLGFDLKYIDGNTEEGINFTPEFIDLTKMISEEYSSCGDDLKDEREEYISYGYSATKVYLDILNKIVNAPTFLHMVSVPKLLIPVLYDKILEESNK